MHLKLLKVIMMAALTVALALFSTVGYAGGELTIDAGGQWIYVVDSAGVTITGYVEEPVGDLVIPGDLDGYPVTGMCDSVFYGCGGITGATIPEGVTVIGGEAFYGCDSLTQVTIPASVTEIGEDAFPYWDELTLIVREGSYA